MTSNVYNKFFRVDSSGVSVFKKTIQVFGMLFLGLVLAGNKSYAQTYVKDKGIIWDLTKTNEPRLKFRFGTSGINIGGYEGTTLVVENVTGTGLIVETKLTFTDYCNNSTTNKVHVTVKPNSKVGGSTWMGGSEQHDYSTTCSQRKEYDKNFITKIFNVTLEIVSVREFGSKPAASGTTTSGSSPNSSGTTTNTGSNSAGNNAGTANNSSENTKKPCPTYGFKFSNDPGHNCVALDWWSLSTKVNMVDAAGNFNQLGGPDAIRFTIQFRKQSEINWTTEVRNNTGKNTHLLTGLDACTKYEVRLITTCENNVDSEPTNTVRFTTACKAPAALTISNIKDHSAQVSSGLESDSFYPCSSATSKIRLVEYKSGTAVWEEMICNPGSPCVLNALEPGTIYRVRSRFKYGNNLFSNFTNEASFTTTGLKPNPCAGLDQPAGAASGSGSATGTLTIPVITEPANGTKVYGYYVELAWNSVIGASSYEILVATKPDFTDAVTFNTSKTRYPPSNYGTAKLYYWKVRAKGPNGKISYWSPPVSFLVD